MPCPRSCGSGERLSGWVDLEGAVNVRDLGGLPLVGGGVTASGVLLRSDNLQGLSSADVAALESLGVSQVVDLRTANEVELARRDTEHDFYFELTMNDVWVWDVYRSDRFVKSVRVLTFKDVNVEELSAKELELPKELALDE